MSVARAALAALSLSVALGPSQPFATSVVAFDDKGGAGGGIFNPQNTLGAPDGQVHSLGIGGFVQLGLGATAADGPGADLLVTENAFYSGPLGSSFAEVMFVEVSSDGVVFARVPSAYYGPAAAPGAFGVIDVGAYDGLVGATPPVLGADPLDVVEAGGDAIDLADLRGDPLVVAGMVDLSAITQVRLVDVRAGVDLDSRGAVIQDPGAGSADPDAVAVLHDAASAGAGGPVVDVVVPADGAFEISVDDPDGWADLDPAGLRAALWGIPVSFASLLPVMRVTRFDATGFTLKLLGSLPTGMMLRVSASARDRAGHRSGDARSRPVR